MKKCYLYSYLPSNCRNMKTIQCAHPPHHHNGFVAPCRLWTAIGGVHAFLVLEPTSNGDEKDRCIGLSP